MNKYIMIEILPNLFLGDEGDSRNAPAFALVVNCTTDLPFHASSADQAQIRVPVKDNGDPRQQDIFVEHAFGAVGDATMALLVNAVVGGGGGALVHCRAGQQRSAAFVAAFLLRTRTCASVAEAVLFIKAKKRDAFLGSVNFEAALSRGASLNTSPPAPP